MEGEPREEEQPKPAMEKMIFRIVCSGCQKELGEKEGMGYPGLNITHSLCPDCFKKELAKLEE